MDESHKRVRLASLNSAIANFESKDEATRKKQIMVLLHEYNDVKDAAQILLSTLANIEGITLKDIHLKYNLPLDS